MVRGDSEHSLRSHEQGQGSRNNTKKLETEQNLIGKMGKHGGWDLNQFQKGKHGKLQNYKTLK